jgi:hypothetical protein
MAEMLECSKDTLERRFAAVIKKGRAQRNSSLRRKQFEVAMKGDRTMLIWLGKQYLEQRDKHEVASGPLMKVPLGEMTDEQLAELAAEIGEPGPAKGRYRPRN